MVNSYLSFLSNHRGFYNLLVILLCFMLFQTCQPTQDSESRWPEVTRETKPWTRWWWHGSAVTKEGITEEMEAYQKAGIGGLEITPIYGVVGHEDKFVEYLSPQWIELLLHTLKEGERLDIGIDMATGTGWPFGGPWVKDEDASKNFQYKIYELSEGQTLNERIEFIQPPYLRAVGNQTYEVHDSFSTEKTIAQGTRKEPLTRIDPSSIDIKALVQPVAKNKNLQALALDQVIFERPLVLQTLMAFGDDGQVINLLKEVDANGKLKWIAPSGKWKLYAIFEGSHGKMVERAGPGGEGYVIDHFSANALRHYLNRFDSALEGTNIESLRAFFNDSYEVDDARGAADWTSLLLMEFKKRRGYNLEEHLPALLGHDDHEKNKRILCDYRETISDMVFANFTQPWGEWAHGKSAIIRNQAHGAPSNILDLYGAVDIPEIEGVDPLRIKMASSAANVTGKKLISSESATWLGEHFESNLADIKSALDRFMLNGVNHLFYHGTAYSPPGEPWPGWLFYAAVHLNPRNPLWNDFAALNMYVSRCQSFLQNSIPDNDVLLYYPIYERFSAPGEEMIEHFDGIGKQFENTAFERGAEAMLGGGYSFDYISDKPLQSSLVQGREIKTKGKSVYKTIVVPHCEYIPLTTFQKIVSMAEEGATIIALEGLPGAISGFSDYEVNTKTFEESVNKLTSAKQVAEAVSEITVGQGRILIGDSVGMLLAHASIRKETLPQKNIRFIRKKKEEGTTIYFISNDSGAPVNGWLPVQVKAVSAALFDPMNGEFGSAPVRSEGNTTEVYVQLNPSQTIIIETRDHDVKARPYQFYTVNGKPEELRGTWSINFQAGGPTLPPAVEIDTISSWTKFGYEYASFSGTATYSLSFNKPKESSANWMLDLGSVKESADVILNGKSLGTTIGPIFQLYIDGTLLQETNKLEISVSNLMANRISDMDRKKIFWRKFYNVNFPSRKPENRVNGLFDASNWQPRESGLLGPVTLVPVILKTD
jgi:hypothetical protein